MGLLVNENYITVQSRPNELKAHDDILGRRDFRHCIQCSGSTLDDEESGHAADKLESDRTMLMRVVPKGSSRVILGDIDLYFIGRARLHQPKRVIANP